METQVGHIYEPALIIWKSALENRAPKGQEMCSRRPDVFLQVTASVAANDRISGGFSRGCKL